MAKKKKNKAVESAVESMRRVAHEQYVQNMREGRIQKAHTFTDRKKQAKKDGCKKKNWD